MDIIFLQKERIFLRDAETTILIKFAFWRGLGRGNFYGVFPRKFHDNKIWKFCKFYCQKFCCHLGGSYFPGVHNIGAPRIADKHEVLIEETDPTERFLHSICDSSSCCSGQRIVLSVYPVMGLAGKAYEVAKYGVPLALLIAATSAVYFSSRAKSSKKALLKRGEKNREGANREKLTVKKIINNEMFLFTVYIPYKP